MKFLFIVQGEGRGHMTQAISLQHMLSYNGHQVAEVLIGKSKRRIIPDFFYKNINAPVHTYQSPNFLVDKKQKSIRIFPSIFYNLAKLGDYIKSFRFINRQVKKHKPDAIINFYELMCGLYFFLYRPKIKHLCIGHQYLSFHPDFEFPSGHYLDRFLLLLNTKLTAINSTKYLSLSFRELPHLPEKKLFVVPPLLRKEVLELKPKDQNYILAYILNDGYRKEISEWHQNNKDVVIHFFSDGRNDIDEETIEENLTWHKIDGKTFLKYMENCKAFASTAGFESVCEAMYLRKPIMMVPTGGHFEQQCNALDAQKAGAGIPNHSFDLTKLIQYIDNYDKKNQTFRNWVKKAETMFIDAITNK